MNGYETTEARRDANNRWGDRQFGAFLAVAVFAVVIPLVVASVLGFASAWMRVLGLHPQATLWGWLSDRHREVSDGHSYTVWSVSRNVPAYYLVILTAWLAYQVVELVALGIRELKWKMT